MTLSVDEIVGLTFRHKASLIHRPALAHLCTMARLAPKGLAVEIGVYRGSSLLALCLARGDGMGEVVGVDNWCYPDPPDLKSHARYTLEQAGVKAKLYDMDSKDAAKVIPGPLAFVHIDADHRYAAVKQDIELWAPKIMPGGVIAFHDYGRVRDDIQVQQAVDEWLQQSGWECLGEVWTTIGFRRP